MENDIELLSVGDASLDTFISPLDMATMCELDTKKCLICFSYGDKIPVKSLEFSVGGNAANNAVGTKRLGIKSAIVITLGDDHIAYQILDALEKERINLTYVFRQPETRSNYSTIINYQGERTIFVYHAPRSYEYPVSLPKAKWMYLTSMGENFEPFYKHIVEFIQKNPETKLAFNPGSWQLRVGVDKIKDILALVNIIFVNKEEAGKLTGIDPESGDIKNLLTSLSRLGPKTVVITDGENGSYSFDGAKYLKVGVLPINAFERTGAGDAFGSGCLAALIKGKTLAEGMLWGLSNSASVIGYIGSQKGLLREVDIPLWLDRCKTSNVEVVEF